MATKTTSPTPPAPILTPAHRENAERFALRWHGATSEKGEAQTFTNEFFDIFGMHRRTYARFEAQFRRKATSSTVFADLFWAGRLLIESKGAHKDSDRDWADTLRQAADYCADLLDAGTPAALPEYILLNNFRRLRLYRLQYRTRAPASAPQFVEEVRLEDLPQKLDLFAFLPRFAQELEAEEERANAEASARISAVHKAATKGIGKTHGTALFLSRLLFCLFADDTGIFARKQFDAWVRGSSASDLTDRMLRLFRVLNTAPDARPRSTPAELSAFPYVNGGLFSEEISALPAMSAAVRDAVL